MIAFLTIDMSVVQAPGVVVSYTSDADISSGKSNHQNGSEDLSKE